jgi:ribosomal protein L32E
MDNIGKTHDRIVKSKKSIRKSKADRKQDVLEEYHKLDKNNKKPYRIANEIRDSLERKKKEPPKTSRTIIRYLEEEGYIKIDKRNA